MDTSKEYVKMCEEAWPVIGHIGAYFILYGGGFMRNLYAYKHPSGRYVFISQRECSKGWFQVYSQDQIQDMMIELSADIHNLLQNFGLWISANYSPVEKPFWASQEYLKRFSSAEQLWLAFYMREAHDKTWTGEKWEHQE